MRTYLNSEERTRHIIALAAQENLLQLKDSTALTIEEKRLLNTAVKSLEKFNVSVYGRFGKAYMRKIENTMKDNDLRLIAKGAQYRECISHAAAEDLKPCVSELMYECFECKRCDWQNCPKYGIAISCDIEGKNNNGGCPYAE